MRLISLEAPDESDINDTGDNANGGESVVLDDYRYNKEVKNNAADVVMMTLIML